MRGGFSVYALEVEAVLEDHPDVLEAAVVPLPDERLGEVPVGELPRTGTDKVRRREIVALLD
jgi:non-ribosomal peptide synthetase component E (peptide arylation enzyme)